MTDQQNFMEQHGGALDIRFPCLVVQLVEPGVKIGTDSVNDCEVYHVPLVVMTPTGDYEVLAGTISLDYQEDGGDRRNRLLITYGLDTGTRSTKELREELRNMVGRVVTCQYRDGKLVLRLFDPDVHADQDAVVPHLVDYKRKK